MPKKNVGYSKAFNVTASMSYENKGAHIVSNVDTTSIGTKKFSGPECSNVQNIMSERMDVDIAPKDKILLSSKFDDTNNPVCACSNSVSQNTFTNNKNDSIKETSVHRLKGIKRKRPKDAKISNDEFSKSIRVLDEACKSVRSVKNPSESPRCLGFVSFTVLEENLRDNRQSITHLSFDEEDNEEDMFAEAKDDIEDVEEFGTWDYESSKSSSFHGFSMKESEYSKNAADRCGQWEKLEKFVSYEAGNEWFFGFSSAEIDQSQEFMSCLLTKRYSDSGNEIRLERSGKNERPSVGSNTGCLTLSHGKNVEHSAGSDQKLTTSACKGIGVARVLPSKSMKNIENQLPDNSKNDRLVDCNSSKVLISQNSCGFSTANGRNIPLSKLAMARAWQMYKEIHALEQDNDTIGTIRSDSSEVKKNENTEKTEKDSNDKERKYEICLGFTTARGAELKISKQTLEKAKAQFDEIKDEFIENSSEANPKIIIDKIKNDLTLGFTTARGGELKISKDAMSKAKAQFDEIQDAFIDNSIETSPKIITNEIKNDFGMGFTTAGGRELKISKEALAQVKAQFADIEDEFSESLFETKPKFNKCLIANVSSVKTSTTLGSTGFTTTEIARVPAAISGKENLTTETYNLESLDFEDFTIEDSEQSKKRKFNEIDDDTPMRRDPPWKRKRGRDVGDLQGRKLFREDSIKNSITSESAMNHSEHNEITRSASQPREILISDDVDEIVAAFIEDEELSREATMSEFHVSREIKTELEPKNICKDEISENQHESLNPKRIEEETSQSSKRSHCIPGASFKIKKIVDDSGEEKNIEIEHDSIPSDLTFDSQFSQEIDHSRVINKCIIETMKIMEARLMMTSRQDEAIRAKRRTIPQACDGSLYELRNSQRDSRISWRELTDGKGPSPREISSESMNSEALSITAHSSASYSFCCADFYGANNVRTNVEGIKVGDDASLILDEKNCAGAREFERAFLASPRVDPNLVPNGWVKNHYRWIVWKLASMDRVRFGNKRLSRMLTPNRVMLELKYRYDREIHRSQWSPLKRILERNEDASARLVLCVASIIAEEGDKPPVKGSSGTPNSHGAVMYTMKLTDGWYSIVASIDMAMINCIKSGKVKEGTKLITFGAKPLNLDQGCSVLEIPDAVSLRIHTNSTRRVRWDTKLDFYHSNRGPMSLSLKSVKPNGGAICKLVVAVARLYPILYREKLSDGQFVFRNARSDEEAARAHEARYQSKIEEIYEAALNDFPIDSGSCTQEEDIREKIASRLSECLPPSRDVTPVLKIRIAQGETSAMMTIWSTGRESDQAFVEGSSVIIFNCFASGQRCNELQITAGRNTLFNPDVSRRIAHPERIFTSLMDVGESCFNPVYGEFDTVGIVSSIGPAPHGMKNFETVNLACPRTEDNESSDFLSVLFWQGVSTHGYSKILTVGTLVACTNLEWRRNTSRSIPTAYCTERTVFTKNPRQEHLSKPFESLRERIKDTFVYAAVSATTIQDEIAKKSSLRTPGNGTSYKGGATSNNPTTGWSPRDLTATIDINCTPKNNSRKASIMKRIEKLEVLGEPPKLPSFVINNSSPKVSSEFRPLVFTPVTRS